ncbi:MAG: 2TM domain-containing protein [Fimbriimonadales bacterium]
MLRQEYNDDEVQDILKRAIAIDATRLNRRETLERTAAELGISPEALAEAERLHVAESKRSADRLDFQRSWRHEFYLHLAVYGVINLFLIILNLITDRHDFWAIYPLLGWGIGIAIHAFVTFVPSPEEYEEKYQEWQSERRNRVS